MAVSQQKQQLTPAFPGAAGGGMYTTGGRGGKVIKITNLNDNGPGSLRQAIRAKGARTIVFEVSGTIELESPIVINNGDLTIAGQTAPGEGICIKGHEVRINSDNVIIRFMRFRPGDIATTECDALTAIGQKDIIIDHCSMSWSTDESASFYDNKNFTLQWCMAYESLNASVHRKGEHGYGGIWGGNNSSFLYNILAHHKSRNPRFQGSRYNPFDGIEMTEMINNVIYNWGDKAAYGGEGGNYNLINNLYIPGPATPKSKVDEILDPFKPYGKYFLSGNLILATDGTYLPIGIKQTTIPSEVSDSVLISTPFPFNNRMKTVTPKAILPLLIRFAGASMVRDIHDQRLAREISGRTFTYGRKGIINSQSDAGGWPALVSKAPPKDSDGDGIPDEWERKHTLDPNNAVDGSQTSPHSGYTNLELYLNELVKNTMPKSFK